MSARRPKGTGSLRHLDGDRWILEVTREGKRLSQVFHATSNTDKNRKAAAVLVALTAKATQTATDDTRRRDKRRAWTVEQYAAYFMSDYAPQLSNTARARYKQVLDNQVIPRIGTVPMAEVTPNTLAKLYTTLGQPGGRKDGGRLSGPTIWTVHNVLRSMFTFAECEGDFDTNPAASKKARPKASRQGRERLVPDARGVEQIIEAARQYAPDIYVPVLLSVRLGTRRGETLALEWGDVDFTAGTVTVARSVSETAYGVQVKPTKTDRPRKIPVTADTLAELKRLQAEQGQRLLTLGVRSDRICATPGGEPMLPGWYANRFRVLAEHHAPGVSPHLLRHAFVSELVARGFDVKLISEITGHSPEVLLRNYTHTSDERKREAMESLAGTRAAAVGAR